MKKVLAPALCAVALASTAAWSQALPTVTVSSAPYVPLTSGTVLTALTGDDVGTLVPLGFSFPYFGQTYTHVMVSTNGVLVLGTSTLTSCSTGCLGNSGFPNTGTPNTAIAGWWDDLNPGLSTSAVIRTQQRAGEFVVEYSGVPRYSNASSSVTLQVKFNAAGSFSVHYGAIVAGTGTAFTASAGFENAAGTIGANFLPGCSSTTSTPTSSDCGVAQFPAAGTLYTVGEPVEPDLAVSAVTMRNLTLDGGNLSFDVDATLRNFGKTAASGFNWRAYLSTDRVLDLTRPDGGAPDIEVAGGGPESLPGVDGGVTLDGGQAIVNVTAFAQTLTPPPTGEYYVLVKVDSDDTVAEASEANNVGATAQPLVQGTDLVATSISGPATTSGGTVISVPVNFVNRGAVPAGTVAFRVHLSLDQVLDQGDAVLFSGTRVLGGGETIDETLTFPTPANAPAGSFYYLLSLDPANAVAEANETNNWVASGAKVEVSRPDLVAEEVRFLDPVTGLATSRARFGDSVQFKVRYRNAGQATANNFKIALILSADSSLSLLSDSYVCDQAVASLAVGTTSSEATLNCTLPLNSPANQPYATGDYFLYGVVDATGAVFESNKANNSQFLGPVRLSAPGPDLAVTSLTAPASAGVGEVVPVVRSFKNLGNLDAPQVTYRFYASANDIITSDDVLLRVVDGASERDEGTVTLARGAASTATELVRLPGTMPPGTYYVGCLLDPGLTVSGELDLSNNALASRTMAVAPSSLRIVNTVLPDAVVGRPYTFRLSALGEQGASTWRIDPLLGPAPTWLSIDATDGLLSGTPSGAAGTQVVGLTVVLENAGRQTAARLALRVLPATSGLDITTSSLPAVVNSTSVNYSFQLGAAGGVRPYQWQVAAGALPPGMALLADGVLTGAPRSVPNGPIPLTIEVRDAVGARATRALSLRVIAPGSITFKTIAVPDALVGQEYLQDVAVEMQDGSALAKPLTWRVSGAVPAGFAVTPSSELITVAGRATQAGLFTFTIAVEDTNGRGDTLDFTMTVHPPRYRVTTAMPDVLRPGEALNLQLAVSPASSAASFQVVNGALPPGLSLDAAGLLSGTVAVDGAEGLWPFLVEVSDPAGATGVSALALRVEREPRAAGCAAVGAGSPGALLAVLGLALLRRRRG